MRIYINNRFMTDLSTACSKDGFMEFANPMFPHTVVPVEVLPGVPSINTEMRVYEDRWERMQVSVAVQSSHCPTKGRLKMSVMRLMPCAPDVCQKCAADHTPDQPHDAGSLYYQYQFYGQHGRWPSWADALSHCAEDVRGIWEGELKRMGVESLSDPSQVSGNSSKGTQGGTK